MRTRPILSVTAACAVLAATQSLHAQQSGGPTAVGIQGGATLSGFSDEVTPTNNRWGGTVGVFGSFRPSYFVGANLEVNWVQKGVEGVRLDYIDVPLTVGGVGPLGGGANVRGYAGFGIGFKVGCKTDLGLLCDDVKSVEWTVPLGVMLGKTTASGKTLGIDVRYVIGLGDAFIGSRVNNRAWLFRVFVATGGPRGR